MKNVKMVLMFAFGIRSHDSLLINIMSYYLCMFVLMFIILEYHSILKLEYDSGMDSELEMNQ